MQEGEVVLAPLPQSDGVIKPRPAILLRELPPYKDFLVCGISSQLHQYVDGFDEIIAPDDSDYSASGLVSVSVIRLGFLALLPFHGVAGAIGEISSKRHKRLLKKLSAYLISKEKHKRPNP